MSDHLMADHGLARSEVQDVEPVDLHAKHEALHRDFTHPHEHGPDGEMVPFKFEEPVERTADLVVLTNFVLNTYDGQEPELECLGCTATFDPDVRKPNLATYAQWAQKHWEESHA